MSLIVDEHRQYLADAARLDAFAAALGALIRPGDVVLDLASGTGILGLLACQAGAARVYAIEMDSIVELGRQIAHDNGFADRIVAIQEMSTRATLPEQVDLIVTDGAGRFGFDAGLIDTLTDARRRFLKPGGRIIPSSLTLWIAPVEAPEPRAQVDFWARPIRSLSFAPAYAIARSTGYPRHFAPGELLSDAALLATIDPSLGAPTIAGRADFEVTRDASLDGVGGWFSADLAPGVLLTNAPGAAGRINRRNVFFPLRDAVRVSRGDRVAVSMHILPETLIVRWRVEVHGQGRAVQTTEGSTFQGMLISREDLARMRPAFIPSLTPAGHGRRSVLELCDGARPLDEIEREMLHRHPDLFGSLDEAAAFVAEVVTRYAV